MPNIFQGCASSTRAGNLSFLPKIDMRKSAPIRILIVDDEPTIAVTLAAILTREGFETRAVYSGEDAIALAGVFLPHALISDVLMPGMNGIEAAVQIHSRLPFCRILLFSANVMVADVLLQKNEASRTFEILHKPVHPTELLSKLRALLNEF